MMSSTEVAALIASQNQAFMGTAQYAQQISAQMPAAYQGGGTIGAYGAGGPPQAQFGHNSPYSPQQSAGFSYNTSNMGYGPGSMAGGMGVSAMGGFAKSGLGIAGMMGGLGMLGSAGKMLDPISMGISGYGAARGIGMGIGASVGVGAMAMIPATAGMAFAQHAIGSAVTGAQQQGGMESILGQHNFGNSGSRTGRGFSREDARGIGDMVRNMAHVPEMMTSVGELSRVMDKISQMGVMSGANNAADFQRKFKETFKTLKEVSKVMGSTVEEAAAFFGESKRAGIHGSADIIRNATNRQVTQSLTGMSQQQIGAVQQQGANMQSQMGGLRGTGAGHSLRTLGQLGAMNRMGSLTNESIMELTGADNAQDGMAQMAGSLQHAAHRFARGNLGSVMTMALGQTKDGRYTGQMDAESVNQARSGQLSREDLMSMARKKTSGRTAQMSFVARRQHLTAEMAAQVGVEGMAMELEKITAARGGHLKDADAQRILMQRFGLGESESGMVQEYTKNLPMMRANLAAGGRAEQSRISQQKKAAEFSVEAIKKKISTNVSNMTGGAYFEKLGVHIRHEISSTVDKAIHDMTGQYTTQITEAAVQMMTSGDSRSKRMASQLTGSAGGDGGRGRNFDTKGILGSRGLAEATSWLSGGGGSHGAIGDLVRTSRHAIHGSAADLQKRGIDVYSSSLSASGIGNMISSGMEGGAIGTGVLPGLGTVVGVAAGLRSGYDNGGRTAHGFGKKERDTVVSELQGLDKGQLPEVVRERLASGGDSAARLAKKMQGIILSEDIKNMPGAQKAQAIAKRMSAGGLMFGDSDWHKLSKGLNHEQQIALLTGLQKKGGTGNSSFGVRGSDIAAELTGLGGSKTHWQATRAEANSQLSSEFSKAGMGESYAGISEAVKSGGAMAELLVGKNGLMTDDKGKTNPDAWNLVHGDSSEIASLMKKHGITEAQRQVLVQAAAAKSKGVGVGGKGKKSLRDLAIAGLGEARAQAQENSEAEGAGQADLLKGLKGGGLKTHLETLASGLKGNAYQGEEGRNALGSIAEQLYGDTAGLKRGSKEEAAARKAMGGTAFGIKSAYGGVMNEKNLTIDKAADKYKLSKEELTKLSGGKDTFEGESKKALARAVAAKTGQAGLVGGTSSAEQATKVATSFEKFGVAMTNIATVFGNIAGIQPPKGGQPAVV